MPKTSIPYFKYPKKKKQFPLQAKTVKHKCSAKFGLSKYKALKKDATYGAYLENMENAKTIEKKGAKYLHMMIWH